MQLIENSELLADKNNKVNMKSIFLIILFFVIPSWGYSQLNNINLKESKQLSYKDYLNLKLMVLSNSLTIGTYQTEQGPFEFPISIYIDDSCYVNFDIYLNCKLKDTKANIEIINDQIGVVEAGIMDIISEKIKNISLDQLENSLRGKIYTVAGSPPIAILKNGKFVMLKYY